MRNRFNRLDNACFVGVEMWVGLTFREHLRNFENIWITKRLPNTLNIKNLPWIIVETFDLKHHKKT